MLYKNLDDLKSSAGFVSFAHKSNSVDVIREDILAAEHDLRMNYLGIGLFDLLQSQFDLDVIVADSAMDKLLAHARRYVSAMALKTGAAKINVDYSKSGLTSAKTQTSVPAREWMLVQLQQSLLQSACTHLDVLLRFLEDNRASFPLWVGDSTVSTIQRRFFLQSLFEFEKYYGLGHSYVTYKTLWPLMDHVQDRYLRKLLGDDFYETILTQLNDGSLVPELVTLKKNYINRIVAYKTIIRACDTLPIKIESNGIVTNEFIANSEANTQTSKAEMSKIRVIKEELAFDVQELQQDLIHYLNKNASDTVYTDWFDSDKYDDPSDDDTEDNEINGEQSGFFTMG